MINIYLDDTDEYVTSFNSFADYLDWNAEVCKYFVEQGHKELIPTFIVQEVNRDDVDPINFAQEELAYRLEGI